MDDLDRQFTGNRDTFRKGQQMQQRILRAAVDLFLEQGFSQTSVREIAKKANTSIGNLYHHFPNKHEILKIIFKQMVNRLRDQITDISKLDLDPEIAFALDLRLGYTATLEDPQLAHLFHMVRTVPDIHSSSLKNKKIRLNQFFGERFSEREIELLAISIQGIADSFFQQRNEGKLPEDAAFLADCIVRGCLMLIGYSPKEVVNIMTIVEEHITKGTVQMPTLTMKDFI